MQREQTESPREQKAERDVLWIFDIALIVKAFDGTLEMLGGLAVLFVRPAFIVRVAEFVTGGELATDPGDPIATTIRSLAHSFAVYPHYFLAVYLILHGFIKVLLVLGIFAGKRVAYPLFMAALAIFGAYELYRGLVRNETLLLALAIFDFFLLILTLYEYRRRYPREPEAAAA